MASSTTTAPGMPRFGDVLKSRDVEDPVNLWLHRPLAYGFCWLIFRTPITPNQVTFFAILLGLAASACWVDGGRTAMIWGGALLWSSAIMDGADGILARAKHMQSAFGRALDGMADWLVGLASVSACIYHLQVTGSGWGTIVLAVAALLITTLQLNSYDFYKEVHLQMTRLDKGGEGHTVAEVEQLRQTDAVKKAAWYTRFSMWLYQDYTKQQQNLVSKTNAPALRLLGHVRRSEASAELYRELNRRPMQIWMALSTAPHSYLFAIFGMLDRLDLYLWLRLTVMNVLMVIGFVLQRRATSRTIAQYEAAGWLERDG